MMASSSLLLWHHLPNDESAFAKAKQEAVLENVERIHMGIVDKLTLYSMNFPAY